MSVKAAKVQGLRDARDIAYGATLADLPILEMSRAPVAVCPDARLRAVVQQRGWRIMDV